MAVPRARVPSVFQRGAVEPMMRVADCRCSPTWICGLHLNCYGKPAEADPEGDRVSFIRPEDDGFEYVPGPIDEEDAGAGSQENPGC